MSQEVLYVGDYGPLTANVFEADGVTPAQAESATIDIVNQETGEVVVSGAAGDVSEVGHAIYLIPNDAAYMQVSGHYVGFMHVVLNDTEQKTIALPFVVLPLTAYLIVQKWQRKVEDSAPTAEHMRDEDAREWIDDAVAFLNDRYDTGFTSTLGSIDPAPSPNDIEFISRVASLLARTAWYYGKGNWRDSEMSFDGTPFEAEWKRLETTLESAQLSEFFDAGGDMYNRDHTYYRGIKITNPDFWTDDETVPIP